MMLLLFAFAIVALYMAWRVSRQVGDIESRVDAMELNLDALRRVIADLRKGGIAAQPTEPPPELAKEPVPAPAAAPSLQQPSPPAAAPLPPPPAAPPLPRPPLPPPRPTSAAAAQPPPPEPPSRFSLSNIDWEGLVGVKLFSWIAGIFLVLGAVLFLRYSVEMGWLTPPIRMVIGIVTGAGLLVACELRVAREYRITANAMDAAGIAILFATFFASHARWQLIGSIPTFALMVLVTAVAVALALHHDSIFIALLGLLGGFATPALLSTGVDRPFGLFGYLMLLNAGLAWVAYKRGWPHLTLLSLIFTTLYQWGWVMKFLTAAKMPIATGIFLVFPVLSMIAFVLGSRVKTEQSRHWIFSRSASISAALPLIFAVYAAAVPAYGSRFMLLFGFLLAVDIGLAIIAIARGPDLLHVAGAVSTTVVFLVWFTATYSSTAWPGILPFVVAFTALYAIAPMLSRFFDRPFGDAGYRATMAAPALLLSFPALAILEPAVASPWLMFGVLFLLLAALAVVSILEETGGVYILGALMALATEAFWSARYLTPERLHASLIIYAGFAFFYLGVPLIARKLGHPFQPEGAGSIVLFLGLGLLFFLATGALAQVSLWGFALLLMILNLGLFIEGAATGRRRWLTIAATILSWVLIAVWWASATITETLVPGLLLVALFAILVLAGNAWIQKSAERAPSRGYYLALAGHLFLIIVASQRDLSVPPWPMLAILGILDLAIGVAALYSSRASLHTAALAVSQFVLVVWTATVRAAPWPSVAVYSGCAIAFFALAWSYLAHRTVAAEKRAGFSSGAAVALFLAHLVAIATSWDNPAVGLLPLLPAHFVLLIAILGLAWITRWHWLSVAAVAPTAIAASVWWDLHGRDPGSAAMFATVLFVPLILYPILLGERAGKKLAPYLAAVLANVPFFFLMRDILEQARLGHVIGVLPLAQALAVALVLYRLLRIEPPQERSMGRLALVAGTVLALITVAIPLQLEKQWITLGWALQAAALAWLYGRVPHRGLLAWASALFAAVFVRLVFNPAVLAYHPRGEYPILNWYLYSYLLAAAAFYVGARLLRSTRDSFGPVRVSAALVPAGTLLLFLLLNIEIADYYSTGSSLTFNFSADLAQNLSYTIGWALFAIGLLVAGILASSRATRISSIALLTVTIVKCFGFDLWKLGGLYRVGSFVGLALCLAIVAVFIQRFVLRGAAKGES